MTDNLATSWCPYCLQTKPGATSATLSLGDAIEDALDAEIQRTENLISSLILKRTRLYRKRNEIRAPIYSLPTEILTLIFKFACPPLDFPRKYGLDSRDPGKVAYPHILSVLTTVSARWHNLILSTPSLWTSFVADDRDIKAMKTLFSRAGSLPVSASLYFPTEWAPNDRHAAVLAPILKDHASQIYMLHVYMPSPTWLKEHIPDFVNLDYLFLRSGRREGKSFLIESSCTRLVMTDYSRCFSLSWSKIEVLHLEHTPDDFCLELLQKCTHLIEYRARCTWALDEEETRPQLPSSPFVLPRLKLFEWNLSLEGDAECAMLQYTRLPALQTLVLVNESFRASDMTSLPLVSAFFERLPPTLSAVEIRGFAFHPESQSSIFSYFLNLPNIESLTVRKCSGDFADHVFSILVVGNQGMPVFPKLKSIHIDSSNGGLDQAKILQTFRRSCSQPSELLLGSPFRIEITRHKMNWMPEFKEELVRMVEKGYRLELWDNSKPVDWLPRTVKLSQGAVRQME
ncbi:hypothetical protein AGABI1DRAFT_131821 [Agaricus bisporus var. burnettii JB137-S8]|uniref:Uncharacterized protein n=1 Tax=Agaricus bisporus var. burnettii (strain JB137-S8 / ATCC MYA-4627 / FGSC 10392) TaxID=597362 RepID=K5VN88_AGABU|nr:uncharacterized protein AGABI1DRAFT_131821 [Agaricus bisporus var. burnettii JB137-S8]EKM75924.1 hypothetical protein AGABI1DRAFT_131821 [Agaricus bisporus var. burnettii JB137-S8]